MRAPEQRKLFFGDSLAAVARMATVSSQRRHDTTRKDSMKRQKRSRHDRAFARGYQAGLHGKSIDLCPFDAIDTRHNWMSGWREGRDHFHQGMLGVASVQNMRI